MIQTKTSFRETIEDQLYFQGQRIEIEKSATNNTTKDMLLIYTSGEMSFCRSQLKPGTGRKIVEQDEDTIVLDLDPSAFTPFMRGTVKDYTNTVHKNIVKNTGGYPEIVEKFTYGFQNEYSIDTNDKLPTLGHPIVVRNKTFAFLLALFDTDEEIRRLSEDIKNAGSPFNYVQRYFNDEIADLGFGLQYINLSTDNVYYASYAQRRVITIPSLSRGSAIRYINTAFKDDEYMYNMAMRCLEDSDYVYLIVKENDQYHIEKFLRDDESLLRTGSLQYADPDKDADIIPIFYTYQEADYYIDHYEASPANVYLKAACEEAAADAEEVIAENTYENKKKMTAIAKVCATMVTTGVAYGVGRTAIEAIVTTINKKKKAVIAENIIRRFNIANMIRTSVMPTIAKTAIVKGGLGVISGYGTAMACGITAASAAIPIAIPIAIGAAVVATTIALCVKFKDKISDFVDNHPVVEKVVNVVKGVATAVVALPILAIGAVGWVCSKVVQGIRSIGRAIGEFFGWC